MVEYLDLVAPRRRPVKAKCVEGCCRLCYLSQLTHLRCVVRPPQEGPKLAIDREFPNLQPIADQLRPAYSGATCCYSLVASRVTENRRPESPFRTRQRERAPFSRQHQHDASRPSRTGFKDPNPFGAAESHWAQSPPHNNTSNIQYCTYQRSRISEYATHNRAYTSKLTTRRYTESSRRHSRWRVQ